MIRNIIYTLFLVFLLHSCYEPERNCEQFRNGFFSFTSVINGVEQTTTFKRLGEIEIDYFEGKVDTSSVRWINDCEYIVKKLNPKNKAEEKSIHMKILSTTETSYTFEYSLVGSNKKSQGIAFKTK